MCSFPLSFHLPQWDEANKMGCSPMPCTLKVTAINSSEFRNFTWTHLNMCIFSHQSSLNSISIQIKNRFQRLIWTCQVKWLEKVRIKTFLPLPDLILLETQLPAHGEAGGPGREGPAGRPWLTCVQRQMSGQCLLSAKYFPTHVTGKKLVVEFPRGQPISCLEDYLFCFWAKRTKQREE